MMAVIRTSLSLIAFGFTIFQFLQHLREQATLPVSVGEHAGRNFGLSLVVLGIAILAVGIIDHLSFMLSLRAQHKAIPGRQFLRGHRPFPISLALTAAVLLLLIGVLAVVGIALHTGPFS
jgi:putative membrane protein